MERLLSSTPPEASSGMKLAAGTWGRQRNTFTALYSTASTISFSKREDNRLCGLMVRVHVYSSRGPGSIPGTTRFSEKWEVSTTEELLGRKRCGSGLEIREYDRRDPSRWPRGILYPQKLTITSPASGGRSVGIVR
jgi:hypothetical protein